MVSYLVVDLSFNHFTSKLLYALLIPNLKLKDLNNKKVMLEDFYSKGPILINFWTLSCEPCKKEMKHLSKINERYTESGFQIVSINMDTPRTMRKVKQFVNSQKYSFKVLSDPRQELFRKIGGSVMPLVILVNMDGTIDKRHIGYSPGDEVGLEKEIVEIILSNGLNLPLSDNENLDKDDIIVTPIAPVSPDTSIPPDEK